MNSLHLHQILINTNYSWVYMGNWITCCIRARDQDAGIPNAGTLTFPTSTEFAYYSAGTDCSHPLPVPTVSNQNSSRKKRTGIVPSPRSESEILSSPYLRALLLSELAKATTNFHSDCLLGEGGFGYVYKGWLCNDTLTAATPGSGLGVAVKKLKPRGLQGHKEWLSEVNYLGQLRHPNLVKLIGFCLEGENRLLVYEFMPRGSLENHLFPKSAPVLPWATRIKVAIAAARGLLFLHDAEPQVIYRDFKASNILLDSEFNAKLSDFGLTKSGPTGDHSHVSTQVMGTQGYTAPEYLATGKLTAKCDVYSFGVVLLELLTGRRVMDKRKAGAEQNLIEWATPYLHDKKKLFRIMDTKLEGQYPRKAATIAATLALHCVHPESRGRPDMSFVLTALEQLPSKYMSGRPFGDPKKMSKFRHKSESLFPGSVRTKHASRVSEGTKSPRER